MSDIYVLLINAKNNKTGNKSFLFTPSSIGRGRSNEYWILPPSTNNNKKSDSYYKTIIKRLIQAIFGNKRIIQQTSLEEAQYIKEYIWDGKIIDLQEKAINPENYPSISSLLENNLGTIDSILKKVDKVEGKLLLVNITYYLEKVNATALEKIKNNCEYHKTMLNSYLNIEQRGEYVYNEETNKVEYKKEPIIMSMLRNIFGNKQSGGYQKKRITRRRKKGTTRKRKKRTTKK
jgi:hypothetical protein